MAGTQSHVPGAIKPRPAHPARARPHPRRESIEEVVADLLVARGQCLALAESCTGGLVCQRLTARPGASRFFQGGVVCYSNSVKQSLLQVRAAVLDRHGAVSAPLARQLASQVRRALHAHWGVAITGIAGPDGGSARKPVGTVFIGISNPAAKTLVRRFRFDGGRHRIRQQSADAALAWLRDCLAPARKTRRSRA